MELVNGQPFGQSRQTRLESRRAYQQVMAVIRRFYRGRGGQRMNSFNTMAMRVFRCATAGLLALALPASARLMDGLPSLEAGVETALPAPAPPGDLEFWQARASGGDSYAQWVVAQRLLSAGANHRQTALATLRQSAENGYSQAELDWGRVLLFGLFETAADVRKGLGFVERAGQKGNAEAAYELAVAYWTGSAGVVDPAQGLYWLRQAAEKGWARAREELGLLLRDGGGDVPRDVGEAARWLELAAIQGRPDAKYALAEMYGAGQGVAHDDARALQLYRELAKAGYLPAEKMIAALVAEGRGAPTDIEPLKVFLEKTAQAGYADAAYELGVGLIDGRFGQADRASGLHWLERAAASDHPLAQYQLAWQGLAAERRVQWLEHAAHMGYTPAEFYLGMAYAYGDGVKADDQAAVDWYRRAAEKGYAEAQSSLGWRYFQGVTLPQDEALALAWSRKAAEQGNELSMRNLVSRLLARSDAASRDEALAWMKRLAEAGHSQYQHSLGIVYSGQSPEFGARHLNYPEALRWWRKAAAQGLGAAEANLGYAHVVGWGVPVDLWQAISWYERAAARGDPSGDLGLASIYEKGRGMLHNPDKARLHRERAARSGNAQAMQQAAQQSNPAYRWMRANGQYEWTRVLADARDGNLEAQKFLATAYLQGNLGLQQSLPNAHHWFLQAAAQGDAGAMNNVGYTLYRGFLGRADPAGARAWFEKAARAGNSNAMLSLAQMHELGVAGKRDTRQALTWLVKAAEADNRQAIARLVKVYRDGELDQKPDPKRVLYWEARIASAGGKEKP